MDAGLAPGITLSWTMVLTALVSAYALGIAIFLILENRSPQSTFAWLFLLLTARFVDSTMRLCSPLL